MDGLAGLLAAVNNSLDQGEQSVGSGRTIRWFGASNPSARGEQSAGFGRTIRSIGANNPLGHDEPPWWVSESSCALIKYKIILQIRRLIRQIRRLSLQIRRPIPFKTPYSIQDVLFPLKTHCFANSMSFLQKKTSYFANKTPYAIPDALFTFKTPYSHSHLRCLISI